MPKYIKHIFNIFHFKVTELVCILLVLFSRLITKHSFNYKSLLLELRMYRQAMFCLLNSSYWNADNSIVDIQSSVRILRTHLHCYQPQRPYYPLQATQFPYFYFILDQFHAHEQSISEITLENDVPALDIVLHTKQQYLLWIDWWKKKCFLRLWIDIL